MGAAVTRKQLSSRKAKSKNSKKVQYSDGGPAVETLIEHAIYYSPALASTLILTILMYSRARIHAGGARASVFGPFIAKAKYRHAAKKPRESNEARAMMYITRKHGRPFAHGM
jgi:hypothetical protein